MKNIKKQFIMKLITCCMCSGFWISFIILNLTQNNYNLLEMIEISSIISITSELLSKKLDY